MDQPSGGYSVDEAAAILSIAPATLRFWEEAFREELGVPRDDRGELRFFDRHLDAISRIHRLVVEDGVSLAEAKSALRLEPLPEHSAAAPGAAPAAEPAPKPADEPGAERAAPSPTGNGDGADLHPAVAGLARKLQEVAQLFATLREDAARRADELARAKEEIRFIVEENAALQELVARLVERVDELTGLVAAREEESPRAVGTERPAGREHVGAEPENDPGKRRDGPGRRDDGAARVVASSALQGRHPQIRPWRPDDLREITASPDANLSLN